MTPSRRADEEAARAAARVTRRAIRRLDVFEWVVFAGALVIATLGGYGVAWLIAAPLGLDFRATWIAMALLLFVVSGGIAIVQARRADRTSTFDQRRQRMGQREDDG